MSEEHKKALAEGRSETWAVKRYLEVLAARKPGRPRKPDQLTERIARLDSQLADEKAPLKRVDLIQKRRDAEKALTELEGQAGIGELEAGFIARAASYSERKGVEYQTWREVGVSADVLKEAGINR